MAPPRPRGAANLDDSRSEASSGQRDRQAGTTKGRRIGNAAVPPSKDVRTAQPLAAAGGEATSQSISENTGINWATMPLPVLHQYRYAYNLPCPSSFSTHINSTLLSQGIGYRSPTAIAIRNAQRAASKSLDTPKNPPVPHSSYPSRTSNDIIPNPIGGFKLHRIASTHSQGRVSKEHLASAVRKHFNNTAISEQDAIARFVYKVSEERRGREFRLRFQP